MPSEATRLRAASSMGQDTSVPTTAPPSAAMGAALRAAPQPTSRMRSLGQRATSVRTNSRSTWLAAAVEKPPTVPASSQRLVPVRENAPATLFLRSRTTGALRQRSLAGGGSCPDHEEKHLEGSDCLHRVRLSGRELEKLAFAEAVGRAGNGNVGFAVQVQGQGVERRRVLAQALAGIKREDRDRALRLSYERAADDGSGLVVNEGRGEHHAFESWSDGWILRHETSDSEWEEIPQTGQQPTTRSGIRNSLHDDAIAIFSMISFTSRPRGRRRYPPRRRVPASSRLGKPDAPRFP